MTICGRILGAINLKYFSGLLFNRLIGFSVSQSTEFGIATAASVLVSNQPLLERKSFPTKITFKGMNVNYFRRGLLSFTAGIARSSQVPDKTPLGCE